jgi:hypothetical protein
LIYSQRSMTEGLLQSNQLVRQHNGQFNGIS